MARPSRQNFSRNLEAALKAAGLGKSEFAREIGRTPATIGRWISGDQEPSYEDKDLIVEGLKRKGYKITVAGLYADPDEPLADEDIVRARLEDRSKRLQELVSELNKELGMPKPS